MPRLSRLSRLSRLGRHPTAAVLLLAAGACATLSATRAGGPTDEPLPEGTYQLTSNVTYHTDSNLTTVENHRTYTTRLYVQPDGTVELYEDDRQCTPYAQLPDDLKAGRRQPGPGITSSAATGAGTATGTCGPTAGGCRATCP